MATSYIPPIAQAVVAVVSGLAGAPSLVQYREEDNVAAGDDMPVVIITTGDEEPFPAADVSGPGTSTDLGDVGKQYPVGISIYKERLGNVTSDIAPTQDFVLTCQQALAKNRLSGCPTVFGTKLVRRSTWEHLPFSQGYEVSRFAIIFLSAEPRLG